jgi:MFS family permease
MNHSLTMPRIAQPFALRDILTFQVVVCALGYFVDIYDLVLFSIVRVASLKDLGLDQSGITNVGVLLLNSQMAGLLTGGVLWGVLGDRFGRVAVLFGSILIYSLANIANGFVTDTNTYAILRFVAGVGLAGELGAAVTLVTESLSRAHRGYATALIAGFGITGAIFAAISAQIFHWRTAYWIGGSLGILLLLARLKVQDSPLFARLSKEIAATGSPESKAFWGGVPLKIFTRDRMLRFVACVAVGLPCWYILGVLLAFAPEITRALNVAGEVSVGTAIIFQYSGAAIGDVVSGVISQRLGSRNKVLAVFIALTAMFAGFFLLAKNSTPTLFYSLYFILGLTTGYWAVFVTVAAEQFGTNLRATVATVVPNLVRGAVIPMTIAMQLTRPTFGLIGAVTLIGVVVFGLSFFALRNLKDSYAFDLDFLER